jgi:glutathione S-transferase
MTGPPPTLVQFRSSHYNEKARWALDYKRIPHTRRTVLPGFHARPLRKLTGSTQVPVLLRGGEAIADSTHIIAALEASHPEPALYPRDESGRERALALEDFFDEEVGAPIRHAMFFHSMPNPAFVAALFAGGHGRLARGAFGTAIRMRQRGIAAAMNLTKEAFEESCKQIEAGLARLEAEIQPSGYLVGDAFSVADLTAAALFSILVFPEHHPHLPQCERPASVRAFHAAYTHRPGALWVREMYRTHRGSSAAISE